MKIKVVSTLYQLHEKATLAKPNALEGRSHLLPPYSSS